jgi:hypothetical protein
MLFVFSVISEKLRRSFNDLSHGKQESSKVWDGYL